MCLCKDVQVVHDLVLFVSLTLHVRVDLIQVEAMLSRYQTRDKADDQMLSFKSALAEKVDRAEAVPRGGRRGDDFDDVERSLHTLKMAVEELQAKSRDTAVTIEQVKAEGKRKAAVVEEMEKNVARKVS